MRKMKFQRERTQCQYRLSKLPKLPSQRGGSAMVCFCKPGGKILGEYSSETTLPQCGPSTSRSQFPRHKLQDLLRLQLCTEGRYSQPEALGPLALLVLLPHNCEDLEKIASSETQTPRVIVEITYTPSYTPTHPPLQARADIPLCIDEN